MAARAAGHRVVVTGVGAVTPLGLTVADLWRGVVDGRSAIGTITHFDASGFPTRIAAEVRSQPERPGDATPEIWGRLDRKDRFGWIAAADALRDAGVDTPPLHPSRRGATIGTDVRFADFLNRISSDSRYDAPGDHLRYSTYNLGAALAERHYCEGPHLTIGTACASAAQAIGAAYQIVRRGDADVMVAGGCDAPIDPVLLSGFCRLGALSRRNEHPAGASRPFDRNRDGFVLGEGAGMLVLESLDHARSRGAAIRGELLGYGSSSNAFRITDSPEDGYGAAQAIRAALDDAALPADAVDYINAHGTATRQNDRSETTAIKRCFAERARRIPVSSTKSMIGHLVSASGAVELIVSLLAAVHGVVPPTINYEEPDPDCDLDYVPNVARERSVRVALSNSFAFGGVNAALLVGRCA